jgi:hypothetical protein
MGRGGWNKGRPAWNRGKKWPTEVREKIRKGIRDYYEEHPEARSRMVKVKEAYWRERKQRQRRQKRQHY